jgi:nicotinate-nucleotide--dimethylbenzimidazole phosphoribosyltransferase
LKEPAMTHSECAKAVEVGRDQVRLAIKDNVDLIGVGEMGIGNTTSASTLVAAVLQLHAQEVVGRGTGVTDNVLLRKIDVVKEALALHSQEASGSLPFYWLRCVGGYEIAAMTGTILEATEQGVPIVVDGFIATAAAVVASELEPKCKDYCFFGHRSEERAHTRILSLLGGQPILDLKMRLGEGTGAALAMNVIEAASKILCEMATFDSAGVSDKD